jgi:ferredoxin
MRTSLWATGALLCAACGCEALVSGGAGSTSSRSWPVVLFDVTGTAHELQVMESQSVLQAAEVAGLLPGSDCRRGRCLSCAATVISGAPFSLQVAGDSALCEEAHSEQLVLLCSARVCGPGVELRLGSEGEAWEIQHSLRWRRDAIVSTASSRLAASKQPAAFRIHEEAVPFLERCRREDVREADGDA